MGRFRLSRKGKNMPTKTWEPKRYTVLCAGTSKDFDTKRKALSCARKLARTKHKEARVYSFHVSALTVFVALPKEETFKTLNVAFRCSHCESDAAHEAIFKGNVSVTLRCSSCDKIFAVVA